MSENTNNDKISINEIMKRAQEMQQRLQQIQQELSESTTTGTAGGGLITVTLTGQRDCKSVKIDPSLKKEDLSVLEDLVVAAFNDAAKRVEKQLRDKMGNLSGDMLPGGTG